jgi:hypothetical protein
VIEDPSVIHQILSHLGWSAVAHEFVQVRAPP